MVMGSDDVKNIYWLKRSVINVGLNNGKSSEEKYGALYSKGGFPKHREGMILELEHVLSYQ